MAPKLPYEIREALIQVCGKAFWLKDPLRAFMTGVGIHGALFDRYAEESKFKIARHILAELDSQGEDGWLIQRRFLTELCQLRRVPDASVVDRASALLSLRHLKELAIAHDLIEVQSRSASEQRIQETRARQAAIATRAHKLDQLRATFYAMASSRSDPQTRGYGLEDLLAELFDIHDLSYRRPYRTATEQIDGHFEYKGFDYLVEARWRADVAVEADIASFKLKVDKKISSTRGLFVSIMGYRAEVVLQFTQGVSSNIVLMDGSDLSLILEGQVTLVDALELKTSKAAQEGIIFFPLRDRFSAER